MKKERRLRRDALGEHFLPCLVILAICFLAGIILGHVFARRAAAGEPIRSCTDISVIFFRLASNLTGRPLFYRPCCCITDILCWHFFWDLPRWDWAGLPLLSAAFGFFLAFSVGCFTSAFGGEGVLLAFAVFGIRCLLTFPCYFWLAVPAFQNSVSADEDIFRRPGQAGLPR